MDLYLPTKLIILENRLGSKCLLDEILDQLTEEEKERVFYEICRLWGYKDLIEQDD